jgi:hypothetical protein
MTMKRFLQTSPSRHSLLVLTSVVLVVASLGWTQRAEARLRVTIDFPSPQIDVVIRGDDHLCRIPARSYVVIDRHDHRTARKLASRYDCSPALLLDLRRDGHTWTEIRAILRHSPHPVHVVQHSHVHGPVRCGTHAR